MKEALTSLLDQAIINLIAKEQVPKVPDLVPQIDHTKDASHGDLATNLAMVLAKKAGMAPRDLAAAIIDALPTNELIAKTEIAGPGFINFFLSQTSHVEVIRSVLTNGSKFGSSNVGAGLRESESPMAAPRP